MKTLKRFFAVSIAIFMFVTSFSACGVGESGVVEPNKNENAIVSTYGKHDHNFVYKTERDFIKNGKSDYIVTTPSDMPDMGEYALSELRYFIKLSTGVNLEVVSDNAVLSKTQKFISLGKTKQLAQKKYNLDASTYKTSGFSIKSDEEGNVYIFSAFVNNNYNGVLCGVYEFLQKTIDLEIYTEEIFDYKKSSNLFMPKFDIEEIPDFDERNIGGTADFNSKLRLRLLTNTEDRKYPLSGHSQLSILELSDEWKKNNDWVSADGQVLCYSAWKTGMDEEYANNVISLFEQYPEVNSIFMGVPDATKPCACDRCKALQAEYNTNAAGSMIIFLNKVINRVVDYYADTDRYVTFGTFAYEGVVEAPCHRNTTTGKWEPDAPEVVPHERLQIQFCPISGSIIKPLTAKENEDCYNSYQGWLAISKDMSCFMYPYLIKANTVTIPQNQVFPSNIRLYAQGVMTYYFDEVIPTASAFSNLQRYVESKMMWNVNYDYDELSRVFITHVYGVTAPIIQEFYDYYIVWSANYMEGAISTYATTTARIFNQDVFPESAFNVWNSALSEAYKVLNDSEVDKQEYEQIKYEIDFLYFVTNVNRVETYYSKMSDTERSEIIDELQSIYYMIKYNKTLAAPNESTFEDWFDLRR